MLLALCGDRGLIRYESTLRTMRGLGLVLSRSVLVELRGVGELPELRLMVELPTAARAGGGGEKSGRVTVAAGLLCALSHLTAPDTSVAKASSP